MSISALNRACLQEPCFQVLRTKEQLGYEVSCGCVECCLASSLTPNSLRNTHGRLGHLTYVTTQACAQLCRSITDGCRRRGFRPRRWMRASKRSTACSSRTWRA